MRSLPHRRSVSSSKSQSRCRLLKTTSICVAEALEARRMLSGTSFQLYSTISVSGNSTIPNTLVTVNSVDGSQVAAGPVGKADDLLELSTDPLSGIIYGVAYSSSTLVGINPLTATVSGTLAITQQGNPFGVRALSFSPTGVLYAYNTASGQLGTVDLSTGNFTSVSVVSTPKGDFLDSLAFSPTRTLYAILQEPGPTVPQELVTIVPLTGALASQMALNSYTLGDIAYAPDGQIYATNYSWWLAKIDPATAVTTLVGLGNLGALDGLTVEINAPFVAATPPAPFRRPPIPTPMAAAIP